MNNSELMFWKNDDENEGNSSLWMVTFADAMSLLLTFFVLLISFSSFDDPVVSSLNSVSEHLGGGIKKGKRITKANQNIADEMSELLKLKKNVVLSDIGIPNAKKPIDIGVNDFQKTNAIKEILKRNPALMRMLINKKSPPGIKINEYDKKLKEVKPSEFNPVDLKLSLQNLEHFIISEGLKNEVNIAVKDNGEISFEIDCIAIFEEGTAKINKDSERLLKRLANIIEKIPNKIALESFSDNIFQEFFADNVKADLAIKRNLVLINYFTTISKDIEPERFSIIGRGYNNKNFINIEKDNKYKEGIIGVTILAFSESMY